MSQDIGPTSYRSEKKILDAFIFTQGADIIVFPEYGVTDFIAGRSAGGLFGEEIPDPKSDAIQEELCPCGTSSTLPDKKVFQKLSCIARKNSNMADKQPGNRGEDDNCPTDGCYQFNTEVVFNKSGCLVARYHKENLFRIEKEAFDVPSKPERIYFDTEFGRFGLMICYDSVFETPVELVTKFDVTDIIFSTAWVYVYPHFLSVGFHSGLARTLKVNYLSSNIHYFPGKLIGSGIYSPSGILGYTYDTVSTSGKLVVARVPINKARAKTSVIPGSKRNSNFVKDAESDKFDFKGKIHRNEFLFKSLKGKTGHISICSGAVCCELEYSRTRSDEPFALGVFDGVHYGSQPYYLEVCLFVLCVDKTSCGYKMADHTDTIFENYRLTGHMETFYAFPEVFTPDLKFDTTWQFDDLGRTKSISDKNVKVGTVVLTGRNFNKDPGNEGPSTD